MRPGKSKTRESRQSIISPDWNFEKMGIGGLDKEFSDIFRRAFASRVFPPDIVEQMGESLFAWRSSSSASENILVIPDRLHQRQPLTRNQIDQKPKYRQKVFLFGLIFLDSSKQHSVVLPNTVVSELLPATFFVG